MTYMYVRDAYSACSTLVVHMHMCALVCVIFCRADVNSWSGLDR